MATVTTSQPASLEARLISTSLEGNTLECDQIALKAIEAGIPSPPESLEILRAQKEPVQKIQDKQTPLPTPPISRTSSAIANGTPNLSRQQTAVSILSPPESINGNSESSQTSTPRSSTVSHQRQGDSLSNTITCTSPATSNAPSINESQIIGERSLQKSTSTSSNIHTSSKTLLQPSRSYLIVNIDRKYYVSADMPIPEESMSLWQGGIKKRLEDALCRESTATYDSEAALALEFYMAGKSDKNLKPSIMITCCSSKRKKSIKKSLGDLKWLNNSGLRYFIRVDKTFGHRMVQTNESHIEHSLVEARLAPNFETLCGVSARIRDTSSANDEDAPIRFTLGGIVCTDWGFACLTAGHPFAPPLPDNESMIDTASLVGEGSDSGDSDFGWDDDSSPESFENSADVPILSPETTPCAQLPQVPFRPFLHRGLISDVDSPHVTRSIPGDGPRPGNPDWAVFLLKQSPEFLVPNSIQLPGEDLPTFVDGIVPHEELDSGSVWIAAGSGLQRGFLNANPASVLLRDNFRDVHQITLERSLAHGDSGSWVIRGNRLCGCIIAGRDSLPWAYMIPIEQVFDNMSIGHATSLYTRAEIEKWKIAGEKEAHHNVHNSGNTRGHSEADFDCLFKPSLQPANETHNINISDGQGGKPGSPHEFKPESEDHPSDPDETLFENKKASHTLGTNRSVNIKEYPTQFRRVIILFALGLSMFLTEDSLSTAVPYITDRFNSLDDVGWYYSAYLLPKAVGYIPFSIIHNSYNLKLTFIVSIAFAMIGSGISSIGQSSTELIIGRAINGLGAAGIFQGAAIILDDITHPSNKPWTFASIGLLRCVVFGSGPIITGSIIDKAFWKWIFYVNIPIGVAVIIAIFLFFEVRKDEVITPPHYRRRPLYYGATLFSSKSAGRLFYILATMLSIFSVIDALLAINWGGRKYFSFVGPWIGILAGIFIISVFFSLVGYFKAYRNSSDDRWIFIVPLRIFRNRSLVSGILFAAPINSGFWVLLYYLPIWFQAVKGASPLESSIMNLASLLAFILATFYSGVFVTITGYCPPYMITSSVIAAIGAAFLTTFTVTTSNSKWIWVQVLVGFGVGWGISMPTKSIQASLPAKDVKTGIAVLLCAQTLAAAIFSSVAQSIFVNKLMSGIKASFPLPNVNPTGVLRSGILNLEEGIEEVVMPEVYSMALVDVFYLATSLIAFSIFGALSGEWRSVKVRPSAGRVRVENDEVSRQLHPWSAFWTHISKNSSKLWSIMSKDFFPGLSRPKQSPTEEKVSTRERQMEGSTLYGSTLHGSTLHVPEPVFTPKYPNTMRHLPSARGGLGNLFEAPVS